MKNLLFSFTVLFFLTSASVGAKEVNEGMCRSYLNMYCGRCHINERVCAGLGINDSKKWREIITKMAEYDDLDQDVQDTTHACLTQMEAGNPLVCKKN